MSKDGAVYDLMVMDCCGKMVGRCCGAGYDSNGCSGNEMGVKQVEFELRKVSTEDKKGLVELCNAVDRRYLANRMPYPYTDADADWWIRMAAESDGRTGVFRLIYVGGRLAGNISVEQKSDVYRRDAEIGYMLLTEFWSKGIMTEAVKEICRIAFSELDIIRITGLYYAPNVASKRVLEKAGFSWEGCLRNAVSKDGAVYDLVVMGLLRDDC